MNTSQSPMDDNRQTVLLFVDDDPNVLKALRRLFQKENYTIYLAESGVEGLAILR